MDHQITPTFILMKISWTFFLQPLQRHLLRLLSGELYFGNVYGRISSWLRGKPPHPSGLQTNRLLVEMKRTQQTNEKL